MIVTGLSGAGNSTALAALADSGMYCIDNLPVELFGTTLGLIESGRIAADFGLAVGMDVRDRSFAQRFADLKKDHADRARIQVIFMTADDAVIATRFSTTRRKHPLMRAGETLSEAIALDRQLLGPVEEVADVIFDTTNWSPHQLARAVEHHFAKELSPRMLHVSITSFGFKYGPHRPVDMMFDVRFVENPYFVPELRDKSGLDIEVRDYVFRHENAQLMFSKIEDLLRFLLPLFYREGKHYLRVGIGCSGGRHRSVTFAEELGSALAKNPIANVALTVIHRDIDQ